LYIELLAHISTLNGLYKDTKNLELSRLNICLILQGNTVKREATIPFPAPMPTLGEYLQRLLNEGKLLSHLYKFIRWWGDDLFNRTHGNPTKHDYHNYSLTITTEYPVLEDRTGNGRLNVSMIKLSAVF